MQGQITQVISSDGEYVESIELRFVVVPARMQRVEIGDAVEPEDYDLPLNGEVFLAVLQRSFGNPGITLGPVGAAAGEQTHAPLLADNQHPIAVVLHFVEPVWTAGDLLAGDCQAELVRYTHGRKKGLLRLGTTGNAPRCLHAPEPSPPCDRSIQPQRPQLPPAGVYFRHRNLNYEVKKRPREVKLMR